MGEDGHEDDGGVGEDGLEDATVPAGDETKQQAGEEHGGQYYCYLLHFVFISKWSVKWRGERKPFPEKREKAGDKDEQEPWNNSTEGQRYWN